ncbi:hypothetical protein M0R89_19155 (plasmid) [Halorussus limi]|uniref:DUF7982 domain-containing protein n=1 Tax=Halorussus limi TaxID=2938695 RepID=A0A8U0I185_9EURY|nr:hypothetical protein [Halorussus limi]UPV76651.1 hypothetical protein M0R89_19155 [Halorussus limi]
MSNDGRFDRTDDAREESTDGRPGDLLGRARDDADDANGSTAETDLEERAEDLAAQVELLSEENQRLREEYVRARRSDYRRTAAGLLAVGLVAVVGALAFPSARAVLFALGGTGVFGALLTYYLTPERFIAAETGERVYRAVAATGAALVGELGLRDDRVYAPARATGDEFSNVRLFVPQRRDYAVPDPAELDSLFVVTDDERERGVSVPPTGGSLHREFESAMADELAASPVGVASQLTDALVEGLELVERAAPETDPEEGRLTVEVSESAYGPLDRFDNPVVSFLAVGLADALDAPVAVDVTETDGRADYFVTCEWDPEEARVGESEGAEDARESAEETARTENIENGREGTEE